MSVLDYLIGVLFFALTVGAIGVAAGIVVRRRLRHLDALLQVLAWTVIGLAGLVAAELLPAALTILTRITVLVIALALLGAAWFVPAAPRSVHADAPRRGAPSGRLSWAIAAIGVGAVVVWALAYLVSEVRVPVQHIDYMTFTMPGIARWIQSGSIWINNEFTPHIPTGTYPNTGDLVLMSGVLPWHNDAFVRLVNYPLLALVGLATYALARELRAPRASAALLAAMTVATRAVLAPAVQDVKPDTFMLATFGVGLVFLVRQWRSGRQSDLVLAGIGFGLAFGSRWYGISSVVVVLVVWVAVAVLARRRPHALLRTTGGLVAVVLLTGGFWFVRNAVVTGNPIFPVRVAPFGVTIFGGGPDVLTARIGFTIAHYLLRPRIWTNDLLPDYRLAVGLAGLVAVLGTLVGVGVAISRPRRRRSDTERWMALALAAVAILVVCAYAITPGSAQGLEGRPLAGLVAGNARWAMPALIPAAAVTAWMAGRIGRARVVVELVALVAVAEGLRHTLRGIPLSHLVGVAAALAVLAGATALLRARIDDHGRWLGRVASRRRAVYGARGPSRAWAWSAATLALVAALAGGDLAQRRLNRARYPGRDAAIDWVLARAPAGHRVGLAGDWSVYGIPPQLPLFGPDLGNRVGYVGPVVGGMLLEYRQRGTFVAALRGGRYDLLVLGRGVTPSFPHRPSSFFSSISPATQEEWVHAAGYVPVARSQRFILYRAPGSLTRVDVGTGAESARRPMQWRRTQPRQRLRSLSHSLRPSVTSNPARAHRAPAPSTRTPAIMRVIHVPRRRMIHAYSLLALRCAVLLAAPHGVCRVDAAPWWKATARGS